MVFIYVHPDGNANRKENIGNTIKARKNIYCPLDKEGWVGEVN